MVGGFGDAGIRFYPFLSVFIRLIRVAFVLEQISRWYRAKDNRRSLRDDNQENRIPA
jgi:hypothetical protein